MTVALDNSAMTYDQRSPRQQRLMRIRRAVADVPDGLQGAYIDGAFRLVADGQADDGIIATFAADADHLWADAIGNGPAHILFLLELLDESFATIRRERKARDNAPRPAGDGKIKVEAGANYTAQAAKLCKEPAFAAFLVEHYGMAEGDDPAQRIRELFKIESRAALNAAGKWIRLFKEYDYWRKER